MKHKSIAYVVGGVLVLLLAALSQQTRALFSLELSIKNNIVRTGQLALRVTPVEGLLAAENFLPGETLHSDLTVENTGSAPARLALSSKKSAGFTSLFDTLLLKIEQNGTVVFDGNLATLQNSELMPRLAPGDTAVFTLHLTLPADASDALADIYTNITFTLSDIQTG